jgi:outer membrane protein OmpA-like peptidoglycan-associated protein
MEGGIMALKRTCTGFALGLSMLAGVGCASTPAPRELFSAREVYDRVADGAAKQLAPAKLHEAQVALARAEQSYAADGDVEKTKDLAYVAERKAEIAEAAATLAQDDLAKAQAKADYVRTLEVSQQQNQVDLSQTRAEVAADRQVMANQQQALTAEQRARAEADKRARLAMESLKAIAAIKEEARGLVITLNGAVLFATGQSTLLPIAQDRLNEVAKAIVDQPDRPIVVEGHTDSTGPAALNRDLSQHRAEAVREYLIARGVPADQIKAAGMGPDRPIADNKSPEGRANNRRVEIVMEPAGTKSAD